MDNTWVEIIYHQDLPEQLTHVQAINRKTGEIEDGAYWSWFSQVYDENWFFKTYSHWKKEENSNG